MAEPRGKIKDNVAEWQPGICHNSNFAPPDEIAAELAALEAAEAETNEQNKPNLIDYLYEVRFHPGGSLTTGDLEAYDMKHAQRRLRVLLGLTQLPVDTRIIEKNVVNEEQRRRNAARNRRLLRALTAHHRWLQGDSDGVRADLSDENLSDVNLEGRDLSHVSLANAKLSGARLRGAKLVGADLTGADLSGANLTNSNLAAATLTDANLIGADLSAADLKGADLWRANLARCIISPKSLHDALNSEAPVPASAKLY